MTELELWLNVALLTGLLFGCAGIFSVRVCQCRHRILVGRVCYVASLLFLGASCTLAAFHCADSLVPLGLTSSFLVVGMLWDGPRPMFRDARMPFEH